MGSRQHGGLSDSRSGVYFGVHRLLAADAPVRCFRTAGAVPPPGQGVLHPLRVGSAAGTGWFISTVLNASVFLTSAVYPEAGAQITAAATMLVCAYGAYSGIEAVSRMALPVAVVFAVGLACGSGRNRWRDPAGLFCPGWHGGCSPGAGAVFPGPMPQHRGAAVPAPGRRNPGHWPRRSMSGGAGVDGLLPDQHPAGDSGAGTLCLCAKLPHLLDAGGSRTLGGHTAGHHQPVGCWILVAFVRGSAYLYGMVGCVRRLVPRLSRVQAVLWVGLGMAALAGYLLAAVWNGGLGCGNCGAERSRCFSPWRWSWRVPEPPGQPERGKSHAKMDKVTVSRASDPAAQRMHGAVPIDRRMPGAGCGNRLAGRTVSGDPADLFSRGPGGGRRGVQKLCSGAGPDPGGVCAQLPAGNRAGALSGQLPAGDPGEAAARQQTGEIMDTLLSDHELRPGTPLCPYSRTGCRSADPICGGAGGAAAGGSQSRSLSGQHTAYSGAQPGKYGEHCRRSSVGGGGPGAGAGIRELCCCAADRCPD